MVRKTLLGRILRCFFSYRPPMQRDVWATVENEHENESGRQSKTKGNEGGKVGVGEDAWARLGLGKVGVASIHYKFCCVYRSGHPLGRAVKRQNDIVPNFLYRVGILQRFVGGVIPKVETPGHWDR